MNQLKINEVFEKLIENPKDVYEIFSAGKRHELSVTDNGYFDFKTSCDGKELSRDVGGAWFGGNVLVDADWQLVLKPVKFMEAVNSGRRFRPENWGLYNCDKTFRDLYENIIEFQGRKGSVEHVLNGNWYVE